MLRKGTVICLNEAEVRLAQFLGKARFDSNRKAGVTNRKLAPDQMDIETDAVGAEIALCKALNVYPDLTLHPRSGGSDLTFNGLTVDVKQTALEHGRLLVEKEKEGSGTGAYVLMTGRLPEFTFRGFYYGPDVFQECWLKDLGRGECYAIPQDFLMSQSASFWDTLC